MMANSRGLPGVKTSLRGLGLARLIVRAGVRGISNFVCRLSPVAWSGDDLASLSADGLLVEQGYAVPGEDCAVFRVDLRAGMTWHALGG